MQNILQQLFATSKPIIGIDIGKSEVKMVLLEGKDIDSVVFKSYATQSILIEKEKRQNSDGQGNSGNDASQNVSDPVAEEFERLSTAIKRCWKKLNTNVKDVALAIPSGSIVRKKTIMAPQENMVEFEEAVEAEISTSMPFAVEEVNIDFQVLGPNEESPTENDVLIWAARKEKIEDAVAVVEAAGLRPMVLDIEHYAIYNALQLVEDKLHASMMREGLEAQEKAKVLNKQGKEIEQNISIVIDLAYATTKMLVFKNGDLFHTRDNDESLSSLNSMIMNRLNLESVSDAEKARKSQTLPIDYKLEILPQFLENYAQDIARGLGYFFNSTASNPQAVRSIYLTGGGASLLPEGLLSAVKNAIEEEVLKDRVFPLSIPHYLQKNEKMALGILQKDEFSLTVACGLALRQFLRK